MACLDRLPRLSPLIMQLVAKLVRPIRDVQVQELTVLIEKDPLLAGQVLSMSNSALFGRKTQVTTVDRAITMIGLGTLRRFSIATSISNLFRSFHSAPSFSMTRFNLHSVATATFVEGLVNELPVEFPEGAFVAGILHDVGRLLIAVTLPDEFESIAAMASVKDAPLIECERSVQEVDHAELSGLALKRWGLAESIPTAVRFHHEPDRAIAQSDPGPGKVSLSLVLNKADAFVNYLGMSILSARAAAQKPLSLEFPGFPYSEEKVIDTFDREWKKLGDLFR
ncbi:MAG: HDOD domain-containing protein [Bryobacteraceae bacterium]